MGPKSRTRKVFPQISRDSSLPESSLRMAELFLTTTFKRSQLFISFSDSEVVNEMLSRYDSSSMKGKSENDCIVCRPKNDLLARSLQRSFISQLLPCISYKNLINICIFQNLNSNSRRNQ